MIASQQNVTMLASGELDHPECLCFAPDGGFYVGGEAGQIYHISQDGTIVAQVANTGGFVLGVTRDGNGAIHVCDSTRPGVFCVDPKTGEVRPRSSGSVPGYDTLVPNFAVFDASGNLYVSHSGDYWSENGDGRIFVIRPNDDIELFHSGPFGFANGLALSPDGEWLYVAQSTRANIVRIPTGHANGTIEEVYRLPEHSVPDGIITLADGSLIICCYRPDIVYHGLLGGEVVPLIVDHTSELLNRPTNGLLDDTGCLYIANLGGWHLSQIQTNLRPAPLHFPVLPVKESAV